MKVELIVERGPMTGKTFEFSQHDTFLFGRAPSATCCLPQDNYISRHHFLLEVNPPRVFARDLGSLNGTIVNEKKYGGRPPEQKAPTPAPAPAQASTPSPSPARAPALAPTPTSGENAWNRSAFEVELHHGDKITVGDTTMAIHVLTDAECGRCGGSIPHDQKGQFQKGPGIFLCGPCRSKEEQEKQKPQPPKPLPQKARNPAQEAAAADLIMQLLRNAGLMGKPQNIPAFPGYEVVKKLGEGGMGAVYLARSSADGKQVAIKVIRPDYNTSDAVIQRFRDREMALSRQMVHENIVMCYDGNYADGLFYMVMEFVEGSDVQRLLDSSKRIDPPTATHIIIQALSGLEYIHSFNVIHRDLKPPNLLLSQKSTGWSPKIADFGLSKNLKSSASITKKGDVAGSIPYMPPEQIIDFKNVGFPADIYSMGATLYHMLTGTFTRDFPRKMDPLLAIIQTENIPIRKRLPQISSSLGEVIDTAIAASPGSRYQTARDFRLALAKAC
jgi:serine/threonine protein kinase